MAGVTVRELLGHQGGVIRDGRDNDHWQLLQPFPDAERLTAIAAAEGAVLQRNEHFKYSNIGYSLLGLAIEAVTGTGYNAHVQAAVVDPLGLTDTGPEWDPARAGELRGRAHRPAGRRGRPADHPARRHPGDGRGHRLLLDRAGTSPATGRRTSPATPPCSATAASG